MSQPVVVVECFPFKIHCVAKAKKINSISDDRNIFDLVTANYWQILSVCLFVVFSQSERHRNTQEIEGILFPYHKFVYVVCY